ncbi:NAD/NADP octopine/nopaline dehydrogenase family protein (plasmid) [Gemmobacter fulvus]|uniref:2-dehydropantoate 2-reductase n=1 Tax=Gemmobacter fulvus TaxID=2840474 RepID=A0A975PBB7_9RHOB|nr:NAD/NADP octopine/nopaline dehydrogenase family protein [Gemmobacter fulvus]MBT9246484.1 NAD/NADP octopine/nopaline dehydrogenase family protein [Gemmobacter fulvus]QWK92583.1 NAD/NADP octopine/nopaline dehydrogenase family protein [Gemmobacter fulvus]
MRVLILGAGGVACAMATLLHQAGHQPVLWSPSGRGTADLLQQDLLARGALETRFRVQVASDLAAALREAQAVVLALPANGHRRVMDLALPHLEAGHTIIVSAQLSLGAAYLHQALVRRGVEATVIGWGTTVVMGRRTGPAEVQIGGIRPAVPMAVLPEVQGAQGLALCRSLFGARFQLAAGLLDIALGNLNPPVHLANALCNLTRIERGEVWANYDGLTPAVARLIEALDLERIAVARAFGCAARTVQDHFRMTFDLPHGLSLAEMAAQVHQRRKGPPGPTSLTTRFITEDVPFGIVEIIALANHAAVAVPLHEAGLRMINALCGQTFEQMNDLLSEGLITALVAARR